MTTHALLLPTLLHTSQHTTEAAQLAVDTVRETLGECPGIREVIFCCFSESDYRYYFHLLER